MSAALAVLLLLGQDKAVGLIQGLRSDSVEEREAAERDLKALGATAVPALEKAAEDPDAEVAARARLLLRHVEVRAKLAPNLVKLMPGLEDRIARGGPRAWLEALLRFTRDEPGEPELPRGIAAEDYGPLVAESLKLPLSVEEKQQVISAAVNLRVRGALPHLAALLKDPAPPVCREAIGAVSFLGGKNHLKEIEALLEHGDPGIRVAAMDAVIRVAPDPGRRVSALLRDREPTVRAAAADRIRGAELWDQIPALVQALGDAEAKVRDAVIGALAGLEAREAAPALLACVREGRSRHEAVKALAGLNVWSATGTILSLLRDGDEALVTHCMEALGRLGAREAIPSLRRMALDARPQVRREVAKALLALDALEAEVEILALLADPEEFVREEAVRAAAELPLESARSRLKALLTDPEPDIRGQAASLADALSAREHAGLLAHLLGEGTEEAGRALVRMGARETAPTLAKLMETAAGDARGDILDTLCKLDVPESVAAAVQVLGDAELGDRALRHLLQVRAKEVLPELRRRLKEPQSGRLVEALAGLAKMGDGEAPALAIAALKEYPDLTRGIGTLGGSGSIPVLKAIAGDPKGENRWGAIESLDDLDAEGLLDLVRRAPPDPDSRVLEAAILGTRGEAADIERLRAILRDADGGSRVRAAQALLDLDPAGSLGEILGLLEDDDPYVRAQTVRSLVNVGVREAIPAFRRMLQDPHPRVRENACEALGVLEVRDCGPELTKLLRDRSDSVQREAILALRRFRFREAADGMRVVMREGNREVAYGATEWIGVMGIREALPDLLMIMREGRGLGFHAAEALGRMGARGALPEVESMLADPRPFVREHAIRAAAGFRDGALVPKIRPLLGDPHAGVRSEAHRAVLILGGSGDAGAGLEDPVFSVKQAVVWGLHARGEPQLVPLLLRALRTPRIGMSAAYALGETGVREAVASLAELAESGTEYERAAAVSALERLRAREAIPVLRRRLADPGDWIPSAAAEALCSLGDRESAVHLMAVGGDFETLNGLRRPEVWERLVSRRMRGSPEGPMEEVAAQVAAGAGFTLEWPPDRSDRGRAARRMWKTGSDPETHWNAAEILGQHLGGYHWVVEEKIIRILHEREGTRFWKDWVRDLK